MLAGMALYVRLMVYMGLSLFIIRQALGIYGCMRIYAYNLTVVQLNIIFVALCLVAFNRQLTISRKLFLLALRFRFYLKKHGCI